VAAAADAQTCAGGMSLNLASWQLGAAAGWTSAGHPAAVALAAGTDRIFGSLSSGVRFAAADGTRVPQARLTVGTDQAVTLDNRLHVCPMLTVDYSRRDSRSGLGAGGHIAVGWIVRNDASLAVIPSGAVGVRYRPAGAASASVLQRAAEVDAAIGFVVRGRVALTPRLLLSHARDELVTSAMFEVRVNVGRR
jgi:hypothetical protein